MMIKARFHAIFVSVYLIFTQNQALSQVVKSQIPNINDQIFYLKQDISKQNLYANSYKIEVILPLQKMIDQYETLLYNTNANDTAHTNDINKRIYSMKADLDRDYIKLATIIKKIEDDKQRMEFLEGELKEVE